MEPATQAPVNTNIKPQQGLDDKTVSALESAFQTDIINEVPSDGNARSRLIPGIIVGLTISILLIIFGLYIIQQNNLKDVNTESPLPSGNSGIFQPPSAESRKRNISGTIYVSKNPMADLNTKYELYDTNNKLIGYLVSKKIDLNISTGIPVDIVGNLAQTSSFNGVEIIEVDYLEFK